MTPVSSSGWRMRIDGALSVLSSPRGITLTVVFYLAVIFTLRMILFPGASEDDAETLFLAQSLEGGYKPGQPPLYIWLAYGLTQVFGPALSVVLALKFFCLATIYILTHRLAHLFTGDGRWAAVAALSILGIYYLSWDAVLNYSQTVLLAALALAFLHALVWLGGKPSSGWIAWVGFGVITGAGVLTKYNFAVLVLAVLAAAMMDHDLRGKLLGPKGFLAALIVAGIVLPHGIWLLGGGMSVGSIASTLPTSGGILTTRFLGVWDMVVAVVSVLSPLLILVVLFFPRAAWKTDERDENGLRWQRLCERSFWALLVLMTAAVLISGVTEVRNHWFIVLTPFPAYAVLRIAAAYPHRLGEQISARVAGFVCVLAVLGLAVGIGVMVRALTLPAKCDKCKMVVPYAQLADGLSEAGFSGGTVYVHDYPTQVGGNLRRFFPESRFISYKFQAYTPPPRRMSGGQCLAVWLLGAGGQSPTADAVLGQLHQRMGVLPSPGDVMSIIDVGLPGRAVPLSYGYILIDDVARQGACL